MSFYDDLPRKIRSLKYRYDNEALNEIIGCLELLNEVVQDLRQDHDMTEAMFNDDLKKIHERLQALENRQDWGPLNETNP